MKVWRCTEVLTDKEMETIHRYVLRILEEVGGIVQNKIILRKLEEYGAKVDYQNERVWFPEKVTEKFIAESDPVEDHFDPAQIKTWAGTYGAFWMTQEGRVECFTEKTIKDYIKLCRNLNHVDSFTVPIPHDKGDLRLTPLVMRLLTWKYVEPKGVGSTQIQNHRLIPYVIEMARVMADEFGGNPGDYILGDIEFQSPFRCSTEEAAILTGLWEKGFRCGIGGPMPQSGASAPVTLAGTLTQHIAEIFFKLMVERVMFGTKTLRFGSGLGVMDMQTGEFMRSRPENALFALALGQMAHQFYRGNFRSYSFAETDGQMPSMEAGFQTAMNVFTGILAGSKYIGGLGLLCQPTGIISALKLIIDNECLGLVKRFIKGFEINEETIALDLIRQVGPGGNFLDQMHTAEHCRTEHWQPSIFNRKTFQTWKANDGKTDLEKAKDIYLDIMKKDDVIPLIEEKTENALLAIIQSARRNMEG
jgi:trimethylamine---corrinoid protein Co-methyltransferase